MEGGELEQNRRGKELERFREELELDEYNNRNPVKALKKLYDLILPGITNCIHEWEWDEGDSGDVLKPGYGKYRNNTSNLANKIDSENIGDEVTNRNISSALRGLADSGYIDRQESKSNKGPERYDFGNVNLHELALLHRDLHMEEETG